MDRSRRRLGLLTAGGDCPGLNAVIRAVTKTATAHFGFEVVGFIDGYEGLLSDRSRPLAFDDVRDILARGGTILGTANKGAFSKGNIASSLLRPSTAVVQRALRAFRKHRLEGLVCIGGDGSLTIASRLHEAGVPAIGVPKTIDNDVMHTDQTFGFDTAATVAAEAIDRLHSTAESHQRVLVVEVMGREAGWIALTAGIAGGGDIILIPERPYSLPEISRVIRKRFASGRNSGIIIAAEGAHEVGKAVLRQANGQLGGVAQSVAYRVEKATGVECRSVILGYLQRGGTPTPFDRVLATRYGYHAALLAAEGRFGRMVCLRNNVIESVPLSAVAGQPRQVPLDSPLIAAAEGVGTSFGVPA